MRFVLNWILAVSFVMSAATPAFAGARAFSDSPRAQRAVTRIVRSSAFFKLTAPRVSTRELTKQLETAARHKPREAMVGVGHTLLFIMVLAGIDLTAQEVKRRKDLSAFSPDQLAAIAMNVSHEILDTPEIWMGIAGAGGLSIAEKPAMAIASVLAHPRLRSTMLPMLARAITATIAFVGWEFGSQLWVEASLRLENDADYRRATSAIGMGAGILKTALRASSKEDRENARVARLMMKEMVHIVLHDSKLRAQWFDNTWRLKIMTGEFSTMLTAMIGAGAIGTALFPGAGTVVGLIFGVVGGVVAIFLPQGFKDGITHQLQGLRFGMLEAELAGNSAKIKDAILPVRWIRFPTDAERNEQAIKALIARRVLRSKLATIAWERMYRGVHRMHTKQISNANFDRLWNESYVNLKRIYTRDLYELNQLLRQSGYARNRARIPQIIATEINRVRLAQQFIGVLEISSADALKTNLMLQYVEVNRARSFDENEAVRQWLAAAM